MTDSMNFGPEWLRNLSDTSTAGMNTGGQRYQLAEYRYGREEMLALFEKGPAPTPLSSFTSLYSEQPLVPLALIPPTEEERQWIPRGPPMGVLTRGGRGGAGPGDRGRPRGARSNYQPYGRNPGAYETGGSWGNGEQSDWSPRKDFNYNRPSSGGVDNWRRSSRIDEDDGWRSSNHQGRGGSSGEKWSRSSSWREGDAERAGQEKPDRGGWHENRQNRRMWENEDHLPEWATENMGEGGGTFDATGAFHGSDDEQEGRGNNRKEHLLQKSASQQNITPKSNHPPLSTSKSALVLSKPPETNMLNKKDEPIKEIVHDQKEQEAEKVKAEVKKEESPKAPPEIEHVKKDTIKEQAGHNQNSNMAETGNRDEDFDKIQEDLVLKLVIEEEPSGSVANPHVPHSNGVQPPPNIMSGPLQEKWYYQDPQGDLQGPFLSTEMAEWFRAGYFTTTLFVRRQCDERFYTLGDLVTLCGGNPFQTNVPIAPLKSETKISEEMLQYHQLMQAQLLRARTPFVQGEPSWNQLQLQQRELMAQQLLAQQQLPPEPYLQQPPTGNPMLMNMLNQLQQVKVPVVPPVVDKPGSAIPCQLDPLQALVQQITMQNRIQPTPTMGGIKHENNITSLHGLPVNGIPGANVPVLPTNNIISGMPKPMGIGKMDGDNPNFMQFLQKPTMEQQTLDLESLWKNQFASSQPPNNPAPVPPSQWQAASDKPISMWDLPPPTNQATTPPEVHQMNKENTNLTKEKQIIDANKEALKEEKKRKEFEEKQAKKEAEEKRKLEQKKLEAEKKQLEEKRKKEEERLKRELEKAKKESEEKRLRELAEKRRLKEQRKAEEDARKKAEEVKRLEEIEREKLAAKEREEQQKKQVEYTRQMALNMQKTARAAPWSQSVNNQGLSLSEIQKRERELKAEQVALLQQQQRLQQMQEQNSPPEKATSIMNWVNKPIKQNQVKSLAEIQAEEQERLSLKAKQANEKAMQQKKEEALSPPTSGIWSGQSLTWTNNDTVSGFWDEPPQQKTVKQSNAADKINKQNANNAPKPATNKTAKPKTKKEDTNINNNSPSTDEFTEWCNKTLSNMNTQVDIPTFVGFLRDIESAIEVREYCREYLGDKPATQQFANQFLEKRRLFKPKVTIHKDDMCIPAPAINPSTQHNTDFQEVKGKGKKCKKSKMLKVDARILGFNVTAAQDRINVGDRDYGDTT